jgi:uncharacterized protein (TIGR02099 family)
LIFFQKTLRFLLIALLLLYFVAATTMLGVRYLVLPHINDWRPAIEKRLSTALGAHVTMGEIAASWSGLNPTLALENLRLRDLQTNLELLYVPEAFAIVSWRSIFARDLRFRQLEVNGIQLSGSRRPDRQIVLASIVFDDQSSDQFNFSTETPAVRWLLSQDQITVRDATFYWNDHLRKAPELAIEGISFDITNSIFRHQMRMSASLPHELGSTIELIARTDNVFNPLASHEQGEIEVFMEVNDAQPSAWSPWFDIPTAEGRFASRLWLTMNAGRIGRATIDFAGSHAALHLDGGDSTVIRADHFEARLSGWLGDLFPEKEWLLFDRSPNRLGTSLTLSAQGLRLESSLFEPRALSIGDVSANTQWNRNTAQNLQVTATELGVKSDTMQAEFRGKWTQGQASSPGVVDITGTIDSIDPKNLYQYVTTQVSVESREWLRRALRSGTLKQLDLTLQGDLSHFPFNEPRKDRGVFRLEGQIDQVMIDYDYVDPNQPQWPAITIESGSLLFNNLGLTIKSDQAHVIGMHARPIQISELQVQAPDLDLNPNLSIRLHSVGLAQDFLSVLNRTPIQHDLGKQVETLEVRGQASMPLSVDFDLEQQRVVLIHGQFQLSDVSVALEKEGVPVEKINGVFEFNNEVVIVKEMRGQALGGPVSLTGEWGPKVRELKLAGELTTVALEKHQKLSALLAVSGKTTYQADIKGAPSGNIDLEVRSSLEGLTIKLPPPLGKVAGQKRPLTVRLQTLNHGKTNRTALTLSLGNLLNARFERVPNAREPTYFSRGAIVMGGPAVLPAAGLTANLRFDRVNWNDWQSLTDQFTAPNQRNAGASSPEFFPRLQQLRVRSPEFIFADLTLSDLNLMLSRKSSQTWSAQLQSNETQGVATWTQGPRAIVGPVVARFSKLSVGTPHKVAQEPPKSGVIDAKHWSSIPAIDLTVEDLTLFGSRLGALRLVGANADKGARWMVNELEITNPHATLTAKGTWLLKGPERGISLDALLTISNLGKLSDQLGHEDRVHEGSGTINAKIHWLNFPWVFSYTGLSGQVNIDLKGGVFKHVNSRSARLLEVLSLQSLQRILSFNFRTGSEFKDGFPWSGISGDLSLSQGIVQTKNLLVRSPIAQISLIGSSDLTQEVWNMQADVRPVLDMSGAAVATAFVVNPLAGLSALVTQFLLRNPIERAMSAKYDVKGTWDEPELIPVGVPTPISTQPELAGG